jgi:anti-sigma factor RsiW
MASKFTHSDLEAYLDEALAPADMAEIERQLRTDTQLGRELAAINARRDAGVHTLGEIWRRQRISCPTREQLGSFLLGALAQEQADYIAFHIEKAGCRFCRANHDDLKAQQEGANDAVATRRKKYFQSSAGYLRK